MATKTRVKAEPTVQPPAIHPDFLKLRDDIKSRTPTVTEIDVVERLDGISKTLDNAGIMPFILSEEVGIDLSGLDIPKQARLVSLYHQPKGFTGYRNNYRTYSICIGLKRSPKDVRAGRAYQSWRYQDYPEYTDDAMIKMPAVETDDVTLYAKFQVFFEKGAEPTLHIIPFQRVRFTRDSAKDAIQELRQREKESSSDEAGYYRWAKKALETNPRTSIFRYRDRDYVMLLLGIKIAESLGIKKIGVGYERGEENIDESDTYKKRERELREFLQKQETRYMITSIRYT